MLSHMMSSECASFQVCGVMLLGLWCSSVLATGGWYPKTLPCDVTLASNDTVVNVDCTERGLLEVPKDIPRNTTNLTLTINHIPHINSTSFQGLENLTEIDMRCNCVPIKIGPKDRMCTESVTIKQNTFKDLRNLKALYLDGNQLSSIPKGLPPNLILLSLEVNQIYTILKRNLSDITNVQILYLGQNCYYRNPCNVSYQIEEGAFLQLGNMTVLSLKSNNLSYIPPRLPTSLRELYLYNNKIEMVTDKDFHNLTQLEILDLSGNCPRCYNAPFPCIPCPNNSLQIDASAFKALPKLRILRLHSNSLTYVLTEWFQNCTDLRVLDLSTNFLAREITMTYFPRALPNLEELDLSFNYELQRYPATLRLSPSFSFLKSLKVLRIRAFVFQQLTFKDISPLIPLKNLEVIDLGTNFIKITNLSILMELKNFKIINLSDNKISSPSESGQSVAFSGGEALHGSPMSDAGHNRNGEVREIHYFRYDEYARSCKYKDKEDGMLNSFVNTQCSQFGKTLDISRNNIFFLHSRFLNLADLRCLNLSGNAMSQSLNGSEFTYLTNLKYLDFSYNRLDLLYSSAFRELKSLVILDISNNNHYFESEGLTHMLNFTKNLTNLKILLMNYNKISTSTNTELESFSLEKLEFKGNRLDMLWRDGDTRYINYFKKLLNLRVLDISHNNLNFIPQQVFQGLPDKLTHLHINNNRLKIFSWEKLTILQSLEVLDLSSNSLSTVPPELSNCTESLKTLLLHRNQISKLSPYFLKDAFSLKHLDLSFNHIQNIEQTSIPDDVVDHMDTLVLNNNKFMCNCNALMFVMWLNRTMVNIPRLATDVTCAAPGAQRGHPVISLDLELQACQHNYMSIILYILLTSLVLSFVTLSISSHLFLWDVWYIYHFLLAKFKGYRRLSSPSAPYDAFVVYDKKDPEVSEWVLKELLVQLEDRGDHPLQLCLEERDWIPGCPLIDNLSQSIHQSKRTVFILTNKYIKSGDFKTAFYMAHQRLMDERDDVIVLIFLEKVPSHSKYLRLRKRLYRRSVMEWPTNPQAQQYFWFSLRSVLATDSQKQYSNLFKETL
ncbi:toll-like receptor 7 [Coregonus clupeaformis]|uniref:toll-like receptor 7 n=1 Tax=Coregonus clupeaformis TaxID=59861 RepID=UPI001BDFE4EB|nr:toll-like receptor 7 [Coregonus clupeaformis]